MIFLNYVTEEVRVTLSQVKLSQRELIKQVELLPCFLNMTINGKGYWYKHLMI